MPFRIFLFWFVLAGTCLGGDLTGNWVVEQPNAADGTVRKTYFDLKQEGTRITRHIRVTQFYYSIKDGTGGADGFTLTGSMMDGHNERTMKYEGKLTGDELQMARGATRTPRLLPWQLIGLT